MAESRDKLVTKFFGISGNISVSVCQGANCLIHTCNSTSFLDFGTSVSESLDITTGDGEDPAREESDSSYREERNSNLWKGISSTPHTSVINFLSLKGLPH